MRHFSGKGVDYVRILFFIAKVMAAEVEGTPPSKGDAVYWRLAKPAIGKYLVKSVDFVVDTEPQTIYRAEVHLKLACTCNCDRS